MRGKSNASDPTGVTVPLVAWCALGIVYVVWGSTYLAIKISIETLPPLVSTGVRFTGAALVLLTAIAALRPRTLRVTRAQATTAVTSGLLLLAGGNAMVVIAEGRISSGLAALLVSTTPLWVVVLRTVLGDRPALATIVGVAVGFVGVGILLLPGGSSGGVGGDFWHGLLVVGAAFSWASGSLLSVRRPMPANPFVGSVIQMLAGGLVIGTVGAARGELRGFQFDQISLRSGLALLYLLVVGSIVAFTAYVWVLRQLPVSTVTTYAYVNPVLAVFLGAVLLSEPVGITVLVGGAVIVVAVAVVVTAEGRLRRASRIAAGLSPAEPAVTQPEPPHPEPAGSVTPVRYPSASSEPLRKDRSDDLSRRAG